MANDFSPELISCCPQVWVEVEVPFKANYGAPPKTKAGIPSAQAGPCGWGCLLKEYRVRATSLEGHIYIYLFIFLSIYLFICIHGLALSGNNMSLFVLVQITLRVP